MAPAGLAIALWLAGGKTWRLALEWCLLFGVGMALVVVTKVLFIGWGIGSATLEFAGISGHAMRAGAILPVAFFVILKGARPGLRGLGVVAGVALALLISVSRVQVNAHSSSEAISGSLLGLLLAGIFLYRAGAMRELVLSRTLVALSLCGLLLTPNVEPVPTEQWLTELALHLSGRERPFERSDWKLAQRHPLFR
ncbi:phosphatase PAP2 family protein [Janthinobacterium sp. hw3]|uniref:Phosphatase PAP2 family protein n=2 Tax=Janthinobacterium fluminis TaxID=2987524 RepID=A0ABT5K4Q4_9BURK|nr:phosphatase PAP2 family protein [Janthinobacterium fluminis]